MPENDFADSLLYSLAVIVSAVGRKCTASTAAVAALTTAVVLK
jgi:hypothetical protein